MKRAALVMVLAVAAVVSRAERKKPLFTDDLSRTNGLLVVQYPTPDMAAPSVVEVVAQAVERVISVKWENGAWTATTNYYAIVNPADLKPFRDATNQLARVRAILEESDRSTLNGINATLQRVADALKNE